MVSKRVEYDNHDVYISMDIGDKTNVETLVKVIDDDKLPTLTEPKSQAYINAKAEQMYYQDLKSAIARLNSSLDSDYFRNAVDHLETNFLCDLSAQQIKSLRFRREILDKETGKTVMQKFPAGEKNGGADWLSWTDVTKAKALGQAGFGMIKLVTAKRQRAIVPSAQIKKFWN